MNIAEISRKKSQTDSNDGNDDGYDVGSKNVCNFGVVDMLLHVQEIGWRGFCHCLS